MPPWRSVVLAALATALLLPAWAAAQTGVTVTTALPGPGLDRGYVSTRLGRLAAEVESARAQCLREVACSRSGAGAALERASQDLSALLAEFGSTLQSGFATAACAYAPPPGTRPAPISSEAFAALAARVHALAMPAAQVEATRQAARGHWFTAEQIADLLRNMGFGATQLQALEHLSSKLTDPENGRAIEEVFQTNADRVRVRSLLAEGLSCPGSSVEERRHQLPRPVGPRNTGDF